MTTPATLRSKAAICRERAERAQNIAHHAGDNAPGSFVTGRSGRTRSQDKKTERALDKTIKYYKIATYWNSKAANYEARARWIETTAEREAAKLASIAREKQAKRAKRERPLIDRIHRGYYPCAVVWWDNGREKNGDYLTLAMMSYRTLVLKFEKECNPEAREIITQQAKEYKAGNPLQIAGNCTITLGE
jgi:hypothetical protein